MAGSFERIAGAKEENTVFGPISRFWESPFRHLLVKEEAPQYLKMICEILNSDEIINPTPNQVAGFIGGINSHKTDPNCELGEHRMKNEEMSMSSRGRGLESAATDEGEARGVHVKRNGVGAGVEKTMSMAERGEKGGKYCVVFLSFHLIMTSNHSPLHALSPHYLFYRWELEFVYEYWHRQEWPNERRNH